MKTPSNSTFKVYLSLLASIGVLRVATISEIAFANDPFGSIYGGEEEFITLATGTKKNTREAPAIVTVIVRDQITHSSARSLEEVLERVAGIHVSYAQAGYTPIYHIRGITGDFNSQALTMINDVPITHIYNGDQGVLWTHMPISVIERIEIVRGPGSVLYGADAYAGVINIITKNTEAQPSSVSLQHGSFDTTALSGNNTINYNDWQFGLTYEIGQTDGFDKWVESDLQSTFDQIDNTSASNAPGPVSAANKWLDIWAQARQGKWSLDFGYQGRYDAEQVVGWYGALDNKGIQNNHQFMLSSKYRNEFEDNSSLEHHASLFYSEFSSDGVYLLPEGNANFPNGLFTAIGLKEVIGRYNLAYNFKPTEDHTIRIGLNTSVSRLYDIYENKNFNPDLTPTTNGEVIYQTDSDDGIFLKPATRRNIGIYAQDEYAVTEDSTITLGVRYDRYNDFGSTFNPRAAWVHRINDTVTSKVLYGTAFLAPSLYQLFAINNPVRLGNENLQPDTIKTLEGSLIFQLDQDEELSFNVFQNRREDIIELVNGQYENHGEQKGLGIEVEYRNDITNLWTVRGNISIVQSTDVDTNTQSAYVPQRQFFVESLWRINPQLSVNLEAYLIADRQRTQDDIRTDMPDNKIINFTALYEPLNTDIAVKFGITNFLDEDISEPSTFSPAGFTGQYFPANDLPLPGRQVFAEVRWNY